ncbi:hypothetical protein [Psychroserpens jangbogonensis]|uniref:hypothetical protein n=1 Tax=Psychroserpens jangbogonensis TaxID=1484460 RepID=UPI00053E5794|nr:hypothetical protein [Psychroserpens jangbogonensis]
MEEPNQLKSSISDPKDIEKLLPHRKPMIMVDTLEYFSDKKGISKLSISEDNIFVSNGFFSETGILEHMAQTAALHIGYKQSLNNIGTKEGFIGAIKSSQIISLPKLNDILTTEIEVIYEVAQMMMVKIKTSVNGNAIAISEMSTVLKD